MIAPIELERFIDAPTLVELAAIRPPQPSGPIAPVVRTVIQPTIVVAYQLPRDAQGKRFLDVITPNPFTPTLDLVVDAVERFRVLTGSLPTEIVLSGMRYLEMYYTYFEYYYAPVDIGRYPAVQHIAIPYIYESNPCYQVRCRG